MAAKHILERRQQGLANMHGDQEVYVQPAMQHCSCIFAMRRLFVAKPCNTVSFSTYCGASCPTASASHNRWQNNLSKKKGERVDEIES